MTEAALFYETARSGLGDSFLDDVQRAIDAIREHPEIGDNIAYGFRRVPVHRFPFGIICWIEAAKSSSRPWHINVGVPITGSNAHDC